MNCQLCQKELNAYRDGKLSDDMRTQVEAHLKLCAECAESYGIESLADTIINQEKVISPDNYLSAKIMARIENAEETDYRTISPLTRILRPVLIMSSLAAAIFIGVIIGNIYRPTDRNMSRPVELALIDDAAIESVDVLSNQ
jgi:predicted anti-sigma-YlaC factor YlaD